MRRDADRLVIIGRIELGAVAAPGSVLEDTVDFAQPRRRQPQRHDLAYSHHHIPAHDLDAIRRKRLVISLALELRIELLSGRDWSCFRNTVNITALSAVGAAFSADAGAVCGGAVCAVAPELNARTPASTAILVHDPF